MLTSTELQTLADRIQAGHASHPQSGVSGAQAARLFAEATGGVLTVGEGTSLVSIDRIDDQEMHSVGYYFKDGARHEWNRHWNDEWQAVKRFQDSAEARELRVGSSLAGSADA